MNDRIKQGLACLVVGALLVLAGNASQSGDSTLGGGAASDMLGGLAALFLFAALVLLVAGLVVLARRK